MVIQCRVGGRRNSKRAPRFRISTVTAPLQQDHLVPRGFDLPSSPRRCLRTSTLSASKSSMAGGKPRILLFLAACASLSNASSDLTTKSANASVSPAKPTRLLRKRKTCVVFAPNCTNRNATKKRSNSKRPSAKRRRRMSNPPMRLLLRLPPFPNTSSIAPIRTTPRFSPLP